MLHCEKWSNEVIPDADLGDRVAIESEPAQADIAATTGRSGSGFNRWIYDGSFG
jgi:hypothetical protein